MTRRDQKLRIFADFARSLSSLSTCRRASVGCVVVTPTLTEVLSVGYNGPPAGVSNDSCRTDVGECGCVHAEANALVKLKTERVGLLLVCTTSPCERCAGLVVNCGRVSEVLYLEEYRDPSGVELLRRCGVAVGRLGN